MSFLLGFLTAALLGLTGVGAGSITAPVLILFFSQSPAKAVGTALLFTVAIKIVAAPLYLRRRQVDGRVLVALCTGGIPGTLIGVVGLSFLSLRRYDRTILLSVGMIVSAMALYSLYRFIRPPEKSVGTERRQWLPWIGAVIGSEVGFSSAGAGAMGSVVLMNFTALTPAEVVGTDIWFGLAVSTLSAGWQFADANYDAALLVRLVSGGLIGVFVGARLALVIPPRILRLALGVLLFGLGVELCWRAFN